MNVKRSLQNRIRGWFPQEPEGLKLSIAPDFGAKNPVPEKKLPSTARVLSPINIACVLFSNLILLMLLFSQDSHPSFKFSGPLSIYVVIAIAGVAVGIVVGMFPVYKMLEQLTKGKKTHIKALKVLFIGIAYGILVLGALIYLLVINFGTRNFFTGFNELFYLFTFSSVIAMSNSTYVSYAVWEKLNHCKLWRNNGLFFMVPKSGQTQNSSSSNQKSES
jgi:hypothetical protein